MAAISSIRRAHAPSSSSSSNARRRASAPVFTRPRLYLLALIAWFALAVWIGQQKGAQRQRTFDTPTLAHVHR